MEKLHGKRKILKKVDIEIDKHWSLCVALRMLMESE